MDFENKGLDRVYVDPDQGESLDSVDPVQAASQAVSQEVVEEVAPPPHRPLFHLNGGALLVTGVAAMMIVISGLGGLFLSSRQSDNPNKSAIENVNNYSVKELSVKDVQNNPALDLGKVDKLSVNGQLKVSNTLILTPTTVPQTPTAGQIYFDKANNTPYYYNGTQFVGFGGGVQGPTGVAGANGVQGVAGIQGAAGAQGETGATGEQGLPGLPGTATCANGLCVSLQASSPGVVEAGNLNISGALISGSLQTSGNLTVSGTVTLSSLNSGVVRSNGSGVLSIGTVALGSETTGSYVTNLGSLTGLSTTGNSGAGSTPTLSVIYGSGANTAVQGNTAFTCASGTGNLSGGGNSITLGSGGNCNNITISDSPTFAGAVTVQSSLGVTIGVPNTTDGLLNLAGSTNTNVATIQSGVLGQNTIYTLPDPGAASANICLSTGNCAGAGDGITGSGTIGQLAKFSASGNIVDSDLSESGNTLTYGGNAIINADSGFTGNLINLSVNGSSQLSVNQLGNSIQAGTLTVNGGGASAISGSLSVGTGLTVTNGGLTVSNGGANITGTVTLSSLGAGLVQSSGGGVLSSGIVDRNDGAYFNTTLSIDNGGTGATTFTTNGILYGNGTSAIQATGVAADSILATNGVNVPSLTQTLPTAVQGNITSTGALNAGSITGGFGAIDTGADNITTSGTVQGGSVNATAALQLGGVDINTAGTLTNVAYENQANTFTDANTFSAAGVGLAVTNDATIGGTLGVTGAVTGGTYNGQTISSTANFTGTLGVAGVTTLSSALGVTGATTLTGLLTSNGGITNTGNYNQTGTGTFATGTGMVSLNGATTVTGNNNFTVGTGATSLGATLAVTGVTTLSGQLIANDGIVTNNTNINAGTGTITSGNINGQTISSAANFTGTLNVQGATLSVGTPGTTVGSINLATSASNARQVIIQGLNPSGTGDATIQIPVVPGGTTDTVCLYTLGNCAGGGGGITGAGTTGNLTKYTGAGTIGDSILAESGSVVTATGSLNATTALQLGGVDINTAGTLTNVAYENQANTFTLANTFSAAGTALTVTNNASIGGTGTIGTLAVTNNATVGGTLGVTGVSTLTGQLNANGGIVTNNTNIDAGTGTITSGNINGQTISSAANFTGTLTTQGAGGITIGVPSTTAGVLNLANGTNANLTVINSAAPSGSGNATIQIPVIAGGTSDTLCLFTLGNCTASGTAGGDLTGTYPNPTIANLQGTTLTISALASGDVLQYNGSAIVNGKITNTNLASGTFSAITGTGALTAGSIGGSFGNINIGSNTFTGNGSGLTDLNGTNITTGTVADARLSSNVTVQGNTFNGNSQLVQLTAGGLLPVLDGSNLTNLNGSNISTGTVANARLVNSGALTITAGTGLSGGGSTALGGTATLNVVYGSAASTAVEGNTSITCASGTGNLSGGGNSITLGSGGSCNDLTITNSPIFTGTLTTQGAGGITIGVPSTTAGVLNLANGTNANLTVINSAAPSGSGNATIQIPVIAGGTSDTLCLFTLGNCTASGTAGGDLTGTYPNPTIANLQGTTLTISALASGDVLQYNGSAIVNGKITNTNLASGTFSAITGTGALNAGSITTGFGSIDTGSDNITTSGTVQGGTVNAVSVLQFNGVDINTAGTLTNVAYENQANTFTLANTFSAAGTALTVTNNASIGGTGTIGTLAVTNNATVGGTLGVTGVSTLTGQLNANGGIVTNNTNIDAGTGTITSGAINGQTISSAANFTGTLSVGGATLTVGTPGTTVGSINLSTSAANNRQVILQGLNPSGAGNATVQIPVIAGGATDTVCLYTLANCAGVGGGITGAGTNGAIARFTGAGTIGDSILAESGSVVTATGTLNATTALQLNGTDINTAGTLTNVAYENQANTFTSSNTFSAANALTLGSASTNTGSIAFYNATNGNTLTLQAGVSGSNLTITLPTTAGANGDCLQSDGSGALSFAACTGGVGGGVTSLNSATGVLTLANSTESGGTITIANAAADGTTKGIAAFNSTNFSASSGVINTIQNINTSATPTFGGLTATAANGLTLGTSSSATGGIVFRGSGGAGTLTVVGPTTPNAGNYTLSIPAISANANICTDNSVCTGYAPSSGGSYIAKNATDTSSAAVTAANNLLTLTNSSSAVASGVLSLNNGTNTNSTFSATTAGNPSAGQAVIFGSNTNASPTGNLIDLQSGAAPTTRFSVNAAGAVTAASTINGATISGGTLSGGNVSGGTLTGTAVNSLNVSGTAISGTGALTVDANGANTIGIGGISTGDILLGGGSGSTGCTVTNASGNFACTGTLNGATLSSTAVNGLTFSGTAITGSSALAVAAGGAAQNLSLNGSTTGQVLIGGTSTGDILIGGGSGSTGCTVTNASGAFACTSTINGATISGGTLSGGNVSGGTLTGTAVNSLNVSGTAISGTGALTVDANGANTVSIGATSTGDILLGGGSGSTGCTVTNASGNFACTGTIQGTTINATTALQLGGVDINTAGTLTNVAYENQANTFTLANTFSAAGTALTVTNNASIGGTGTIGTLAVTNNATVGGTLGVTGILNANATGKTAIQIADSGAQNSGITIGGDTNLYRSAANNLKTDDALTIAAPTSAGDYTKSLEIGQRLFNVSSSGSQADSYWGVWDTTDDRWEASFTSAIVSPTLFEYNYGGTYKIRSAGVANRTAGDALTFVDSFTVQPTGTIDLGAAGGKTTLQLTSTAADTGITLGGDTNLYRAAASDLRTDSTLRVVGKNFQAMYGQNAQITLGSTVGGSSPASIYFGSASDTNLYRSAANTLRTDGALTVGGLLTGNTGLTISGGTASINNSGTSNTLLGNATGTLSLTGSSSSSFVLNGVTVSSTEFNLLDGRDTQLVDTTDAVNTAITGTGALNVGSITSGFGSINNGASTITTTGAISGGTLNVTAGSAYSFGAWNSGNTDIDGLLPGTVSGGLIQAPVNAHLTIGLRENDGNDSFSILSGGGNYSVDSIYDTVVLYAGANGNVGIGTSSPSSTLDVNGTVAATLFSGSGASLTNLNASNLSSGTVPTGRLTGSYTGITGTGALNAGSITSGFGAIDNGASNITTTGTITGGNVTVTGNQFTNSGSTLNTAASLGNFATGGAIGSAATTVDVDTSFAIAQTTAGQTLSLPNPTTATAGRIAYVLNTGSASFLMHSVTIPSGYGQIYIWNGSTWILGASGGGSAITLQSAYDGGNALTTSDSRDVTFALADTSTDANFRINIASGSVGALKVQNNGTDVLSIGAAGQLQLAVQGSAGGIMIGGDASIYRSGTTALTTNSSLTVTGSLTGASALAVAAGGAAQNLTLNGSTTGLVQIGAASTGNIEIGGGSGSTGCTLTNASGAFACTSTINGATLSGGTLSGGNVSGGTLTGTAVNSLNVSGTAISGTGALTIDANGANTVSIGGISTGNVLLGGGSGSFGCTVTNATGALACDGTINGQTLSASANFTGTLSVGGATLTVGTPGTTVGSINLSTSAANNRQVILQGLNPSGAGNATVQIPVIAGGATDTVCLFSLANCALAGAITGSGTSGNIVKFNGTSSVTNSGLSESGTTLTYSGNSVVNTAPAFTGNIINLQVNASSRFSVNEVGAVTASSTFNGAALSGGTLSGGNVSGGTLTGTAVNSLNVSGTAISGTGALTVDANGANTIGIGGISTGNILLGGGSGSTGCTVTNASGAFACTSTINGATISGGTLSGGNVSGGTLTGSAVNSLNVSGTAISGTGALTVDANGASNLSLNGIGTGDILLGGGSGSTGCTVTNSNGNLACAGTVSLQTNLYGNGLNAIQTSDTWLRLNNSSSFTSGTYTPGLFRADGGLQVTNSSTFNVTSGGVLTVGGAATLNSTLAVNSSLTVNNGTGGTVGLVSGTATAAGYVQWHRPDGTTRIAYQGWSAGGANNLGLNLENSAAFQINGGDVGIGLGSTAPSYKLHVVGNIGSSSSISSYVGGANSINLGAFGSFPLITAGIAAAAKSSGPANDGYSLLVVSTATGGALSDNTPTTTAGTGGGISLIGAAGGIHSGTTAGPNLFYGGTGGQITLQGGTGGDSTGTGAINAGGYGGNTVITGGTGGSGVYKGYGGNVIINGGAVGASGAAFGTVGTVQISSTGGVTTTGGSVVLSNAVTNGTLVADIYGTGTNRAVCHSGAAADTENVQIVDCTTAPAADYAEFYPTETGVEMGDLVMIGPNFTLTNTKGGEKIRRLIQTNTSYASGLLGIISDPNDATDFNVIGANIEAVDNPRALALKGRVTTKVNAEGGAIQAGDMITSSSVAGVGMKANPNQAGMVVGVALEDYTGTGQGEVLVFVNPYYYSPPQVGILQDATYNNLDVQGDTTMNNLSVTGNVVLASLQVTGNAGFADLNASGLASVDNLLVNGAATVNNLNVTGNADFADLNASGTATVSGLQVSGATTTASLTVSGAATINSLTVTNSASVGSLTVVGDANIGGVLTVGTIKTGNIEIDGHIVTKGDAPTSQILAAAGAGATVAIEGNDTAGTMVFTTGNSPATGELLKLIFSKNYGATPRMVFSPSNQNAAGSAIYKGTTTTQDSILNSKDVLSPNTEYKFDYFIVQ